MNCRQAKLDIALCVGEDLTDADRREKLRQHLTGCRECRSHLKRLKGMFHVLEKAEGQQTYDSADSLWPELVGRLGHPRPKSPGPHFNGWVPFSVMAAACVLLMIVMEMQPETNTAVSSSLWKSFGTFSLGQHGEAETRSTENTGPRLEAADSASFGPSPERLVEPLTDQHSESNSSF